MKKKILILFMITIMLFSFVGCGSPTTENLISASNSNSMFAMVESTSLYEVLYHKDTKVMYVVSRGYYNQGTFTIMLNAEGMPLLYEE